MFIAMKTVIGLVFVLSIMYLLAYLLRKYTKMMKPGNGSFMSIDAVSYIDDTTKVVSLSHAGMNYLVLIGKNGGNILLDKYERR
jgi:hypothetical protein